MFAWVQGEPSNVALALRIIVDAVDHYKQLTEGACCGKSGPLLSAAVFVYDFFSHL